MSVYDSTCPTLSTSETVTPEIMRRCRPRGAYLAGPQLEERGCDPTAVAAAMGALDGAIYGSGLDGKDEEFVLGRSAPDSNFDTLYAIDFGMTSRVADPLGVEALREKWDSNEYMFSYPISNEAYEDEDPSPGYEEYRSAWCDAARASSGPCDAIGL
mmetsp:Transcript_40044/g.85430  ORF Transcript_40044/g.85430 Transcript_40044/m.85430 type:complete len:157 (-) Transcript_40044:2-472(-)